MWDKYWILYMSLISIYAAGAPLGFFFLTQYRWIREGFKANPECQCRPDKKTKTISLMQLVAWLLVLIATALVFASPLTWGDYGRQSPNDHKLEVAVAIVGVIAIVFWFVATGAKLTRLPKDKILRRTSRLIIVGSWFMIFMTLPIALEVTAADSVPYSLTALFNAIFAFMGLLTATLLWHVAVAIHASNLAEKAGRSRKKYLTWALCISALPVWIIAANLKPKQPVATADELL